MTNVTTITGRIANDRWFAKTLRDIKNINGKYNPEKKTWTVDMSSTYNQATIRKLGASFILVEEE